MDYTDGLEKPKKDAWIRRNVWSAPKFLGIGLVLSGLLYFLFEGQAKKLEALSKEGKLTTATVTKDDGKYTAYEYQVDGKNFEWNVTSLRKSKGDSLEIMYLPAHPELNRPGHDFASVGIEAQDNRDFLLKLVLGINAAFLLLALRASYVQQVVQKRSLKDLDRPVHSPQALRKWVLSLIAFEFVLFLVIYVFLR